MEIYSPLLVLVAIGTSQKLARENAASPGVQMGAPKKILELDPAGGRLLGKYILRAF